MILNKHNFNLFQIMNETSKRKNDQTITNIQFQQENLNNKLNTLKTKIEKIDKLKVKMVWLESRIKRARTRLLQLQDSPYIVISNVWQTDIKSNVYQLFKEANIPKYWICKIVNFNKIVIVYLLTETVKEVVKRKLKYLLSARPYPKIMFF